MDYQLNNPLRPTTKLSRTETSNSQNSSLDSSASRISTPETFNFDHKTIENKDSTHFSSTEIQNSSDTLNTLNPEVKKALDTLNASDELKNLLIQLKKSGIELSGPRKSYIKHSYEIEEELHRKFHEMYPVLGYKKVKDAINDAVTLWCEKNKAEYQRRCGPKK